ncbi:MFS general substrate transporter [Cyathus striatus]|nr:MFS general substrate transporter [Cyathus striatus]
MSLPSSLALARQTSKTEALDDDITISVQRSASAHEETHLGRSEKHSSKASSVELRGKEGKVEAEVVSGEEKTAEDDYPDGGFRAWLIVFGGMCNTFSTFGYVNSWGVFQGYYEQTILSDTSPSSIAWIGSLQYSLVFFPSLFVGRLFDLGYTRTIFLSSSALLILSTFLTAECKVYWQFVLCQGIAVGLACGGIFGPTTAVIAHWFKKRRGLAMGFVAVGSSLGGTVLPIATKNLLPIVGFKWTIRIIGFILIFTVGLANIIMKRRLPPKHVSGGLLNLKAFKSAAYTTYCLSSFVTFLGLYTVLTYVGVSATSIGISNDFSFYFIAIGNASSLFGRYTGGLLCDRIGPMNVMIPFTAAAGILTYAWPFARTERALIAVTVIYGFCSGAYVSLLSNPMMDFGEIGDVGRRIGMYMSILAVGALAGPPISGQINTATGGFEAVGYYAGSCVLVGVGLMCLSRYFVLRRLVGRI